MKFRWSVTVDDATVPTGGYWIIKNSWGYRREGDNGYDFIPYGNIEVHNDISAITGAVYYTGAMATAHLERAEAGTWSDSGGINSDSELAIDRPLRLANQETAAIFAGTGGSRSPLAARSSPIA